MQYDLIGQNIIVRNQPNLQSTQTLSVNGDVEWKWLIATEKIIPKWILEHRWVMDTK